MSQSPLWGVYRVGAWCLRAFLVWRLASLGNVYRRMASTKFKASASTFTSRVLRLQKVASLIPNTTCFTHLCIDSTDYRILNKSSQFFILQLHSTLFASLNKREIDKKIQKMSMPETRHHQRISGAAMSGFHTGLLTTNPSCRVGVHRYSYQ